MNSDLPKLRPPVNDFVNCDDNLQVKRVVSSSKLKEGFKHTVKVVDSHISLQNIEDQTGHVLSDLSNRPNNWMRKPTASDVDVLEKKITEYELEGRKVRSILLNKWLKSEMKDINLCRDPVGKLIRLRRSMPDNHYIFPCVECGGEGLAE